MTRRGTGGSVAGSGIASVADDRLEAAPGHGRELPVRSARIDELDARCLYALLRLRVDVFVVEQRAAYAELDGRDVEPTTVHVWIDDGATPVAYLRVLDEPVGSRIGRVVTAPWARGRGHGSRLLRCGLALATPPVALGAQAHLADWYAGFGFVSAGPGYDEDGIAHVPMTLDQSTLTRTRS